MSRSIAPEITGGEEAEPVQLWLVAPLRGAVQGEYVLQRGRDNSGQPLWRQLKGPSWLFKAPDGHWRFASSDLELVDHVGHIQSAQPEGNKLPNQVALWQHYDGSAWYDDNSVSVTTRRSDFDASAPAQAASQVENSSLWLVSPRHGVLQGEYRKQDGRGRSEASQFGDKLPVQAGFSAPAKAAGL
ncbi:unnamed protein product [Effrenium voratum]|nr:unnamed protein product [Effrenium voratum]